MLYNEMKRNASGYYDETPYKAVLGNCEAGDVLESGMNKVYLILKNHGKFSTALALFSTINPATNTTYEVVVDESGNSRRYYTNPAMIQYVFNDIFMNRAGTLEQDDFLGLMETVGENLGVTIKVSKAETDEQAKLIDELIQDNERLRKVAASIRDTEHTSQEAAFYKRMYHEIIDRLIAKGGV